MTTYMITTAKHTLDGIPLSYIKTNKSVPQRAAAGLTAIARGVRGKQRLEPGLGVEDGAAEQGEDGAAGSKGGGDPGANEAGGPDDGAVFSGQGKSHWRGGTRDGARDGRVIGSDMYQ